MGRIRDRARFWPRLPHTPAPRLRTGVERPDDADPLPDDFLTLRVKETFAADIALQNVTLGIETVTGVVWLSGCALRRYQILRAVELANRVSGVRGVRNCMERSADTEASAVTTSACIR